MKWCGARPWPCEKARRPAECRAARFFLSVALAAVCQPAHDRSQRGFGRAAVQRHQPQRRGASANRIAAQVDTTRRALAGQIHARAAFQQGAHRLLQPCREAARAEGFQNDLGIAVQRGEKGRVKVGRQLDEQHMRVDRLRRCHGGRRGGYVPAHPAVRTDRPERRRACGNKGVHRVGIEFAHMVAGKDFAMHHGGHACAPVRRYAACVAQVARRVRPLRAHGQHRAGQHDRQRHVRQQIKQQRRRVGQGIRAMRDDKPVVCVPRVPDGARHRHPVGSGQVG